MFIQGTLLNVDAVATQTFVRHLAHHAPRGHYFVVDPPPGIVMVAAIDWRVILPDSGEVPPVAAGLWSAFETFVVPIRSQRPNAGIFLQCRNIKGQFDQFTIGADVCDQKALTQRLEDTFRLLSRKLAPVVVRQMLHETEDSGFWDPLDTTA